jgi:hypothetical protein
MTYKTHNNVEKSYNIQEKKHNYYYRLLICLEQITDS